MTTTKTPTAAILTDALEVATEFGARPFAPWVTVTANAYGGHDVKNGNNGSTYRTTMEDGDAVLHVFTGGRAMLLAGSQRFSGMFANSASVGLALKSLF